MSDPFLGLGRIRGSEAESTMAKFHSFVRQFENLLANHVLDSVTSSPFADANLVFAPAALCTEVLFALELYNFAQSFVADIHFRYIRPFG